MTRLAKSVSGFLILWLTLALWALFYFGFDDLPKTFVGWMLFLLFAPLILILGDLLIRLLATPFMLLAQIPPFSRVASWLKCEDGDGDPLFRFAGLAFGLLAVFLLSLKLLFP